MKIKYFWNYKFLGLSLLVILLGIGSPLQAIDLPGKIDKSNCAQYKDLLVPSLYRAVERGDFVITPGKINFNYKYDDKFLAVSAKNAGKYDVTPKGDLIDKATGKYPFDIYGMPFPNLDTKDPKAGSKIIWNFNMARYRFLSSRDYVRIMWINKNEGEERYADGYDTRLYMTGRPPDQRINNPDKVQQYEFQRVLEPMSLKGTNTMAYIFINPDDEDKSFAYVPAIRRIRQTGSTTRSDPYMGSDSWLDMNYGWGGKDNKMTWKYVGEKTILVPFNSPNKLQAQDNPDGSIKRAYPFSGRHVKLGYEEPNWKGAKWAPMDITYVPRKVWIVEQMPKDPYYNWGLHINYIDQETYNIWYKEVFERSGDFRTWLLLICNYQVSPSGKDNTLDFDMQIFIDEKARHATCVARGPYPIQGLYFPAKEVDPSLFNTSNFLLLSK